MTSFDDVNPDSWSYRDLTGQLKDWTPTRKPRTVTASGNVNPLDDLVRVDATDGDVTMTLEPPVGADGRRHTFKKIDASGNDMIITTVDGGSLTTGTQYSVFRVISNGVTWDEI